jgi:hypothetical protein
MIDNREATAKAFFQYTWKRTAQGLVEVTGDNDEMDQRYTDAIVHNMGLTNVSATFRKGTTGQWREEFTSKVTEEFKRRAGNWLIHLGYEKDNEW